MRHNLTSPSRPKEVLMLDCKIDENNPEHLRRIIHKLMQKSKSIIEVLESTVKRLQKVEREKEYWKKSYLNFREICQRYIEEDGMKHFKQVIHLRQQLKRVQTQNQCLIEQSIYKSYNSNSKFPMSDELRQMNGPGTGKKHLDYSETKHKYSFHEINEFNSTSKKSPKNKSMSMISQNGSLQSEHQISPKKKLIKLQTRKIDKNH